MCKNNKYIFIQCLIIFFVFEALYFMFWLCVILLMFFPVHFITCISNSFILCILLYFFCQGKQKDFPIIFHFLYIFIWLKFFFFDVFPKHSNIQPMWRRTPEYYTFDFKSILHLIYIPLVSFTLYTFGSTFVCLLPSITGYIVNTNY